MTSNTEVRWSYEQFFPDDSSKAQAFDAIAQHYFEQNFAVMPKAEIDLLMFSIYLDRIRATIATQDGDVSDYMLSKALGLTPKRVASLKERKEIKYPSEFDWGKAFQKAIGTAEPYGDKVKIYIRDIRLYNKLRELIEEMNSYTETTLTKQLLVVSVPVFVDLMMMADEKTGASEMRKHLKEILEQNNINAEQFLNQDMTFAETLRNTLPSTAKSVIISSIEEIPCVGSVTAKFAEKTLDAILSYQRTKK